MKSGLFFHALLVWFFLSLEETIAMPGLVASLHAARDLIKRQTVVYTTPPISITVPRSLATDSLDPTVILTPPTTDSAPPTTTPTPETAPPSSPTTSLTTDFPSPTTPSPATSQQLTTTSIPSSLSTSPSSSPATMTASPSPPSPSLSTPGTISPVTAGATTFATTRTSSPQPSTTPIDDVGNVHRLLECSPCGTSSCSFSPHGGSNTTTYALAVGAPVMNCQGGNTPITSTSERSVTIEETWSIDGTVGFALGPLNVGTSEQWSRSKSITWGQTVAFEVLPGQKGVLIAQVQFQRTRGSLKVGSRDPYALISNEPIKIVSYGTEIVSCDGQFSGDALSSLNCTSGARMMLAVMTGDITSMVVSFTPLILAMSLLMPTFI